LLDEATSFTTPQGEGSHLPLGYGRITVHASLTARFWAHAHRRTTGAGETLDLQLIDDDGRVLADIADFVLRPVDASAMRRSVRQPGSRQAVANAGLEEAGIRPEDGAEVFRRLLATDLGPQVIVNVRGMADSFARVRAVTTSALAEGARPTSSPNGRQRSSATATSRPRAPNSRRSWPTFGAQCSGSAA
jgi:hypothetical protein